MLYLGLLNLVRDYFLLFINEKYNISNLDIVFDYNNIKKYKEYGHIYCNFFMLIKKYNITLNKKLFLLNLKKYFKLKFYINKIFVKNDFLNFVLTYKTYLYFFNNSNFVIKNARRDCKKNILIEYGGINPNGKFHLGHLRNCLYGNLLINIYKKFFKNVYSHFLVNDCGNQMENIFNIIIQKSINENLKETIYDVDFLYNTVLNKDLDNFKERVIVFFVNEFIKIIKKLKFNKFDEFIYESSLRLNDSIKKTFYKIFKKNILYLQDKEFFVFLDNSKKCLLRNNKYTYFASDCFYYLYKFNKQFDKVIIVIGSDHTKYIEDFNKFDLFFKKKVISLQETLFLEYQLILFRNKRISKRNNNVLNIDFNNAKLLNNIKWFILNFNMNKLINIKDIYFIKNLFDINNIIEFVVKDYKVSKFSLKKIISTFLLDFKKYKILIKKFFSEFVFIFSVIDRYYTILKKIIKNHTNIFLLLILVNDLLFFYKNNYKTLNFKKNKLMYNLFNILNYVFIDICELLSLL
jgi:arginyl-tRNA synthetase